VSENGLHQSSNLLDRCHDDRAGFRTASSSGANNSEIVETAPDFCIYIDFLHQLDRDRGA